MVKVLHFVAIMNRAGEETFIMNVFRKIDRRYVIFDFLCSLAQKGEYEDEIESLGGTVHHLSEKKILHSTTIDTGIKLLKFLKSHSGEFSVFHIHTQHAMNGYLDAIIARMAGIPKVIVHSHSTNTLYHLEAHKLFRPLLAKAKIVRFACSIEAGRWLFGEKGNFDIIRNGIIAQNFVYSETIREKIRNQYGWADKRIIGHVGSFTYAKNHSFILQIFKELHKLDSNTVLVFVGAGEKEPDIIDEIAKNDLEGNVVLMGSRSDTGELYQGMDLFLFPSKFEGLGIVVIEAQTAGLPCLISDVIPRDVDITDCVHRESLDHAPTKWAKIAKDILDADYYRHDMSAEICKAGYDISTTTRSLQDFYIQ